ncbi:transmembrane sensor [Pedobacter africanus]|uniref:Uncharacterized protein n=1 Tax=Pedobacter africanus TaxID=151894 RepID=A0ACC6L1J8_9SPHI|nr:FecR domain-containing protein [Pedobacter africanus]MDR6785234.1 hypothetical protein [Pedobacter africanus]
MNKEVIALFTKYYHNFCSREELDKVMELLVAGLHHAEWNVVFKDEATAAVKGSKEAQMTVSEMEALNQKIQYTLQHKTVQLRKRKSWFSITASAAAVLFLLGIGIYFYANRFSHKEPVKFVNTADIYPGKKGAVLTLSNGKKVYLSEAVNGQLADEAGVDITKTADGQIIYDSRHSATNSIKTNTLSTARGEIYQLLLPDGTRAWINAASTLKYPTSFSGSKNRRVQLSGEAYFEVKKNQGQPFIVESSRQQVEVLGTHFNVNSYAEESTVMTTLLEGSVRILALRPSSHATGSAILKPGEQSVLSAQSSLKVAAVNTETVIAWKNNEFMFDGESIESVMKMISRWYDVEIIYTGNKPTEKFIGSISRTHPLSKALGLLASTGGITFRVEGRKVYVSN